MLGKEAYYIGLANYCVDQNEGGDAAFEKAKEVASVLQERGPVALRMAKKAITEGFEAGPIRAGLEVEHESYMGVIPTEDRIEALHAFKEKRKPNFKGK